RGTLAMLSVSLLLKPLRALLPIAVGLVPAVLIPAVLIASLLAEPASSLAARRTRRGAKPAAAAAAAQQATSASRRYAKAGQYNPNDETVEMFEALDAGKIAVRFIPKDSTQARIFIKNKSGKPLNVRLPAAFAAAPVLAQMGMGGMGMGGMGAGGGGGGQGMGGGGGGMFNVPADKEGNVRVPCVCLEHGKPEPRPQMTYSIKRVESFTTKPGVAELLTELDPSGMNQRAAQAAAWHLNNGMSWEQLAGKRTERADGSSYPYFLPEELRGGIELADRAVAAAAAAKKVQPKQPSPGETAAKDR
ncbi:MAG TPA: hypothetical protein PK867_32125, partial [Pirellulales bacterium]|nr:hypothetical protein [Pirellulales bacterium]